MPDQPSPTVDDEFHDHDKDAVSVMGVLLDVWPAHLTVDELVREASDDITSWTDRDQMRNALDDLIRSGQVHKTGNNRNGHFVFASRAAVRAFEVYRRGL